MLLSIVMMIKNEEKYLDKTLSSLMPLMREIDSELIILDTGSEDKSIEIASKYTDKVYFAKWNNNFGKMRNISISYAKGDWILILDADEELVNYDKMIDFFKSDIQHKYNSASIELKSLTSQEKDIYNRSSILRLFRRDKDFRYEGAIHEQPVSKKPIFNNIAYFNHYGYMYENEEIKQRKLERNEKILLSEIKLKPNDPYIYYQLAKNYAAYGDKQEALSYMKKANDMYNKIGYRYIPVESGLAKLYYELDEYEKCESLCRCYIKSDDKNIDIYLYIALSQNNLRKYNESLENYNRYIFLVDNYEISTQANDASCLCDTISFREIAEVDIINIYYKLGMYENVINKSKTIKLELLKRVYSILFMSLYKLDKENEILNIYNSNANSLVDKKEFKMCLENMILNIKQSDRERIYRVLSCIDDNYGTLNKVRLGEQLSCEEYNEIMIKEKEAYYGELIYYGFKQGMDLLRILKGISNVHIQNYFNYIVKYKKKCILNMYNYLLSVRNTLNLEKLSIYSALSKSLLLGANLKDEKYENLFLMYTRYRYKYLRSIYNENITDEELIKYVSNEEDEFIIALFEIEKNKEIDKLLYIQKIKNLLTNNQHHKNGIEIIKKQFEKSLMEDEEVKELKIKYKLILEESLKLGDLKNVKTMIKEYEDLYGSNEILNIKAVYSIYKGDIQDADNLLKLAYLNDFYDMDVLFNIAYVKENLGEVEEAKKFYLEVLNITKNIEIRKEVEEKIKLLTK